MKPVLFQTKSILLVILSAALVATSVVLGAVPLVTLRRAAGRLPYLLWAALGTAVLCLVGAPDVASVFATLAVLVATYLELEENSSILVAASVSIILSTGVAIGAFWGWAAHFGVTPQALLDSRVDKMIADLGELSQMVTVDKPTILAQLPSGLVILLSVSLWLGLILEKSMAGVYTSTARKRRAPPLGRFYVPDVVIWVLIASTAGTFIDLHAPAVTVVATNIFNVAVMIYFFQGLSVLEFFFEKMKVSRGWRTLSYGVLIAYLFFAISILGVLDYWFNFRLKSSKNRPETIA